ncbi:serine carboxypeptidase-like 1 [Rhynchospora pubera]|uniref:Serine carboxypeptidase-like 1 n=1 Tax=Rhynchospora pubera TaxID=906938 RepID=A0AAV8HPK9_9POAL|nr:serine carboxypeptidase-like 1 [Rhynchospora pubera]
MPNSLQETNRQVFLICLLFLVCCSPWHLVAARNRIKYLPGFNGSLPFALETGYLEVDEEKGVELFYYFIESQKNPEEDPLLLWLTGGPGCSAFSGLVFEIGPLRFDIQGYRDGLPSLFYNPDSWTQVSSVIFVDSPAGTGFSYSHTPEGLRTSDTETVHRLLKFLFRWLEQHPKFKSNPLYIAGDSYCGMIIPVLTLEIALAKEFNEAPFNLKGYSAGNPLTDHNFDRDGTIPFLHGMALISDELYELTKKSCSGNYANPSNSNCVKHLDAVEEVIKDVNNDHILEAKCEFYNLRFGKISIKKTGKEFYDEVRFDNSGLPLECREYGYLISKFWANNDTVREALGIRKGTVGDWNRCRRNLPYTSDIHSAIPYHLAVTNKGYQALIYSGDHDRFIPHVGTQAWIRSLNFSITDDWRPWYVGGQVAGFTRKYSNNLTFATVKGAGHMAPMYKPTECLAMFGRWLSGVPL